MTHARVSAALAALALVLSLASAARPARAMCMSTDASQLFASSAVVFVGRATSIARESRGTEQIGEGDWERVELVVTFAVEERFKGVGGETAVVSEGLEGDAEGPNVETGRAYLVFAIPDEKGRLASGSCGLTTRLEAAAAGVAFCRYVARVGRPPSVVGRIGDDTPPESSFLPHDELPVGGVGVTLEGGGRRFETVTDRDGGFVVADVPEGEYSVKLAFPDGYRLTSFQSSGVEQKAGGSVVLVGKGCAFVDATATRGGAVAGRFVDAAGKPVSGFDLALVRSDRIERMTPADVFAIAQTEADGRFRFDPVAPGDYALVANWMGSPNVDKPPRPSFVVGKAPNVAMTYAVVAGRETAAGDLKAPAASAYVTVDVEVVDEKGAPVNFAMLVFSDAAAKPFGFAHTEDGGRLRVYLPAGRPSFVRLQRADGPAEPIEIDPAKVGPTLRIVAGPAQ